MLKQFLATMAVAAVCAGVPIQASAQDDAAEFFQGKTITYIVATGAGGGYDTYGRLLTRFMEKYLPGTRIIIRYVPGAGQIIGTNTIYVSRPTGLTFGTFNTGLIYSQILGLQGVRFDLSDMSWIGKMADEGRSLVISNHTGMDTIQDLMAAEDSILLASAGVGSASFIETRILEQVLNLNIRIIPGLFGPDTDMSMMRGEVAGVLGAASSHDDYVNRGAGKFVVSIAGARSVVEGVPQAREFVTNPDHLRLLNMVETMAVLGRLTAGPPGIPADRLAVLRHAYMNAVNDPELLRQAEILNIPIVPEDGAWVADKINEALNQTPEVITLLREASQTE